MKLTWLGHSVFLIEVDDYKIIIDPFISGNPKCPVVLEDLPNIDYILLTHGHPDHIGDTVNMLKERKATNIISSFETCQWLQKNGIHMEQCIDMNIGGMIQLNNSINIHMIQAVHSNSILDNETIVYAGYPSGFIIEYEDICIYYSSDTGVFYDMKLIQDMYSPNIAIIPIGGRFTMSAKTASYACNNLLNVDTVIPMHYDTFPLLENDVETFKKEVKNSKVLLAKIGEEITL